MWVSLLNTVLLGGLCAASLKWAFVASDANTIARCYGGTLSYGCYERFQLPTLELSCRVVPRTPEDFYGALCHERTMRVPIWPAPLASAGLVILALIRRPRPGACAACGYSTAGLAGGVCPECGVDLSGAGHTRTISS